MTVASLSYVEYKSYAFGADMVALGLSVHVELGWGCRGAANLLEIDNERDRAANIKVRGA
jgi:hypothetical protein